MSQYNDVNEFHNKFRVPTPEKIDFPSDATQAFRVKFIQEEFDEFKEAFEKKDIEKAIDSLLDIVYVCYGTSLLYGVKEEQWNQMWDEVQRANMSKEFAPCEEKDRASNKIIKPKGWVGPDHMPIINSYNGEK